MTTSSPTKLKSIRVSSSVADRASPSSGSIVARLVAVIARIQRAAPAITALKVGVHDMRMIARGSKLTYARLSHMF